MATSDLRNAPPGTWLPARRLALWIFQPLERFLHVQAASGIVLIIATAVALAWANSPWAASYERLWRTPMRLGLGSYLVEHDLHFWINDGLMAIFFFVVGLEIRREIHQGELSVLKRAVLPVAAALGGMLFPALIYLALNPSPPERSGWGVPMATDIAFAVGALALLGNRVPAALRVLLLALAIIDDIGAILVIAVFYSSSISVAGFGLVALGIAGVLALQRFGVRSPAVYVAPGVVTWAGLLSAGVHPTIAGVLLGLLTPVHPWFGEEGFLAEARRALQDFQERATGGHDARELTGPLAQLAQARREALPPVVSLEAALHPWVAYGIMPLFAFANAGVSLGDVHLGAAGSTRLLLGVVLGLTMGKPLGIMVACFLSVKLGLAALPRGVLWRGVLVVGCVAGIGFTMAIFVAGLAFGTGQRLGVAKLAVLLGSLFSALVAMAVGKLVLRPAQAGQIAATADEAEASTEY
ncbi:Na+/H+ antiporter NhaA [Sorangium atrum]|uniref:Na(+)/H(+) antiporter NhaA n=1 Tax=Sorangium atrum TaxID=2995308 RepID=A0ABT5CDV4_9BACT|nr:Na+/H+ antiporter NhaA [Sorangium aterium]MDC0684567.1 Na+/H+ antiporter NhaA [Sorangium aterium]